MRPGQDTQTEAAYAPRLPAQITRTHMCTHQSEQGTERVGGGMC